jgi:FkbM family methyltransferase
VKKILQRTLQALGYRLERWRPANRFGAMEDSLRHLRALGFRPRVIIDGGANMGQWFAIARGIFPDADFEVVEPLPACHDALEMLARERPRPTRIHRTALTAPGRTTVAMSGGAVSGSTGSFVVESSDPSAELVCPATTLDALLSARVSPADRVLLKLDLEGHELEALAGAPALLPSVEVALLECQFFQINDNTLPDFGRMVAFFSDRGFTTFDFATLTGRGRDRRLMLGDIVFVRRTSPLCADTAWQ